MWNQKKNMMKYINFTGTYAKREESVLRMRSKLVSEESVLTCGPFNYTVRTLCQI